MSSGGQVVGGIVGAAAGFVVGGPTGAIYGAQIGIMAGGLLDPPKGPTVEGPRLGDLSVQTSTYGQFIPRTYGTIGLSGNVFWLENNKLKEVVRKKKSGGKGGGSSSTVKTYTYFATFAVGLCEGPIAGVRRIWVGPDLVYDAGSDDLETIISSNQASSKFTIYLGADTQQPDPRMQAEMGVANCPAFRGLAYIVVKDLKLTNYGNSIAGAQVKVEVVNSQTLSGAEQKYAEETMESSNGNFQNAPFISDDGVSIWQISDSSATPVVSRFRIGFDGALRSVSSKQVVMPNSLPGGAIGSLPNGQGDADYLAFPKSTGNGGITLVSSDYTPTSFDSLSAGNSSSAYHIHGGYVYFACGNGTSAPKLHRGDISTGIVVSIPTSGSNPSGQIDSLGVVGQQVCIGFNNSLHFYDISTLAHLLTVPVTSFVASAYPYMTEFSGGVMYISSSLGDMYKVSDYLGLAELVGNFGASFSPANSSALYRVLNNNSVFSIWLSDYSVAGKSAIFTVGIASPQQVTLASIVASESARSALVKPSDIDASGLVESVTGFKVSTTGSIRNAIEPLRGAWPFDVVQSGYKIKATSRGSSSVVTIPIGELAIDTQLTESREMDSQLPQNVTVKYIDRDRDYDSNEQRAQRDNTEAVNSLVLELPVVLSATQSAQVADKLIRIYALEKSDFSFTLPAPYRYLEPGDVVTIATDDADYVLRLVSVNQTADGRLECAGRPSSAATYTSIAPGDGGQQGAVTIPLAGTTVGLLIDCPVIDEGLQDAPGFAVGMNGYSAGWPGGVLYRTSDNGQTWDDLQALAGRATAGFASGALAASAGNLIQRGGSLTVSIISGTLESVTEAQMLNGANIAAYGVNGRWEILRFQNATLNVDGTYTLDTFWRGDKGTEWATGLHVTNDYFVLMTDPDLAFVGMPTDSIGQPRDYRAVTTGADIDSAASTSFTYDAVNLETLSGVHPKGVRNAGDLTVTWQRRTRVGGAWRDYVDASIGEASQAYEVDIMDGATVNRTLTATTPSVLYTSAMQVTDFGSTQASVTVNIYQLSAVVGRGYKLEATL